MAIIKQELNNVVLPLPEKLKNSCDEGGVMEGEESGSGVVGGGGVREEGKS